MALTLKYQGRTADYTKDTYTKVYTYVSENVQQIDDYINAYRNYLDTYLRDPEGHNMKLTGLRKSQADGPFWHLQVEYTWTIGSGSIEQQAQPIEDPEDFSYGHKSATLKSILISVPLCQAYGYKMKWDHYLIGKKKGEQQDPAIPDWYDEDNNGLSGSYYTNLYRWIKDYSEIPQPVYVESTSTSTNDAGDDITGITEDVIHWVVLKVPEKPGVQTFDESHYSITQAARYPTSQQAGAYVQNNLNKIGNGSTTGPENDFGLDVPDWKCDDASVQWNGNYWLGSLTWTSSKGSGWDEDLYSRARSSL